MDYEKEIPFGAFDSELMHEEISIPEGFEATIEGNKIILKKIESEDEKVRKELIDIVTKSPITFAFEDKGKARLHSLRPFLCPGTARQAVPQEPRNIPP